MRLIETDFYKVMRGLKITKLEEEMEEKIKVKSKLNDQIFKINTEIREIDLEIEDMKNIILELKEMNI